MIFKLKYILIASTLFVTAGGLVVTELNYNAKDKAYEGLLAQLGGDYKKAFLWYQVSAWQGNADAQLGLGLLYTAGTGVKQDSIEAAKWYRKAAEQGDNIAQYYLGVYYFNGIGVRKDLKEAAKWYRKAAEQGHEYAQKELSQLENMELALKKEKELAELALKKEKELAELALKKEQKKKREEKASAEPYQKNDNMIYAMNKGTYGWEVESNMGDYKAMVGVFKIKGKASCYPYIAFLNPPGNTQTAISAINGIDVKFSLIGHTSYFEIITAALSKAGRSYLLNEFRKKNEVKLVTKGKTHTFSAKGFTKGLNSLMSSCEKAAKNITNAL